MKVEIAEKLGSVNIREGDFVLMRTSKGERANPYVMVVESVIRHEPGGHVSIAPKSPAYRLLPTGFSGLALVRPDNTAVFGRNIHGFYSGRDDIARYCEERGWEEHARWIRRLRKRPLELPRRTQVQFIT